MSRFLRRFSLSCALLVCLLSTSGTALGRAPKPVNAKRFHAAAESALVAMRSQADSLHIEGVAVVAFVPGDAVQSWMSEMVVVGHLTDNKSEKGNNLLGIAYAKASEMARTLQNSGTSGQPPMQGEFGWQGGVTARVPGGYLIVAFSGGRSEDDVATSKAGLAALQARL